ncbi:MAG: 4'-phosphopantetheinyl transferase superfamily protein [Kofleriaceae bacterium]|nr:4'-phosphopantetheinyl transferase superfamily protein [Kofleriaceae bacterium]
MPVRRDLVITPHGRCVILEVDGDLEGDVHLIGDERVRAAKLGPIRRREHAAGRAAMREALGVELEIGSNDRGAPILPEGWVGSISHKGTRAAAIVAPADAGFVGVDLELAAPPRQPIEKRILTPREQSLIEAGSREVTLRFAIKEAIYKAVDPIVRRYVGFTEVELDLEADGAVRVNVLDLARLPVEVEAWWREQDGHWLATARARRR